MSVAVARFFLGKEIHWGVSWRVAHTLFVGGVGYVPGVCRKILRYYC